jgi:hypothetical protein
MFLNIKSRLFLLNISYYKRQGLIKKKASNIRYLYTSLSKMLLVFIVLVNSFINWLLIKFQKKKQI